MKNYFEFSEGEKKYLEEINSAYDENLSEFACKNSCAIRKKKPNHSIIRPAYAYDSDYILHSPFYNRYTDKTQVFSFYKNDDLTRRALHVQFVSKIARTIGRALKLNLDLIEAIALGHDIGHTPFGHKGEAYLSESYGDEAEKESGVRRFFNHNVHSARIFRNILDANITLQALSGIIAHNGEKVCKEYTPSKLNSFEAFDEIMENCYVDNDFHKKLRPNTLEGCVVRISDMIAYAGKDRQDLRRAKLATDKNFKEERLLGSHNSDIISNLVINVVKNSINSPSLNMDEEVFNDLKDLISENYEIIYNNSELSEPYETIIKPLMRGLFDKFVYDIKTRDFRSPVFIHHINNGLFDSCYRDIETRKLKATPYDMTMDFIASMTDDYFIDVCKFLHINDKLVDDLHYHEYF